MREREHYLAVDSGRRADLSAAGWLVGIVAGLRQRAARDLSQATTTALDFFGTSRLRASDSASIVCAGTPAPGKPPGEPSGPRLLGTCSRSRDPGSAIGLARWREIPLGAPAGANDGPNERLGGGRSGAFFCAVVLPRANAGAELKRDRRRVIRRRSRSGARFFAANRSRREYRRWYAPRPWKFPAAGCEPGSAPGRCPGRPRPGWSRRSRSAS